MKKINKLELIGIYIIYVFSSIIILSLIFSYESWDWFSQYRDFLLFFTIFTLILTILYQFKMFKSYLLISVLGFMISIFGGIFVLVSNLNNEDKKHQNDESLVSELKRLSSLYKNDKLSERNYLHAISNLIKDLD
jgi:hypothetical protein